MRSDQISKEIKSALCNSLEALALQMQSVADELHGYGGLEALTHSDQLTNASHLVMDWANGISEDLE